MALTIRTQFDLDCPRPVAWKFLTDAEQAVPCFPGAEIGTLRDDGFHEGSFGVKLGPMALKFAGRFKVAPAEESSGKLEVQAQGQDAKGRGAARADVNCQLIEVDGKTRVEVESAVSLTGSLAQFGRAAGMIEAISKQLLERFAGNVQAELAKQQAAVESVPEPALPPVAQATLPVQTRHSNASEATSQKSSIWVRFTAWLGGWRTGKRT